MNRRWGATRRPLLWAGCLVGSGFFVGCGKPAGPLFAPVEPPVVWPGAPERARIRWVGSLAGSDDLHAARSGGEVLKAALRGPRPPIRFAGPHGVAVCRVGGVGRLLAVADAAGGAVHLIDLQDRTHRVVGGWEDERLASPVGVAWAGDRLFVTDAGRHEVIELDTQGRYRRRFGGAVLVRPVGIAYSPDRARLYVVDGGAHCVQVFDLSGVEVSTIGRRGSGEGEFNYPSHVCIAGDRLAVADSGNFRVQLLDLDGRCLRVIGRKGDGAGDFSLPKGVAFDSEGHLYVVDAQFENVQILDASGRLLLAFGEEGSGVGRFSLPAGLAIDAGDRIWVADSANRRVCVFDYLGETPKRQNAETPKRQNAETPKRQNAETSKRQNVGWSRLVPSRTEATRPGSEGSHVFSTTAWLML